MITHASFTARASYQAHDRHYVFSGTCRSACAVLCHLAAAHASPCPRHVQVKKRALELQQRLDRLRVQLEANAAAFGFDALLAEFTVINSQLAHMHAELRPQLHFYVGHPLELTDANRERASDPMSLHQPASNSDFARHDSCCQWRWVEHEAAQQWKTTSANACAVIPEQLASLVLPEMQLADEQLLSQAPVRPADDLAAEAACAAVQETARMHNACIHRLFEKDGVFNSKVCRPRPFEQPTCAVQHVLFKSEQCVKESSRQAR